MPKPPPEVAHKLEAPVGQSSWTHHSNTHFSFPSRPGPREIFHHTGEEVNLIHPPPPSPAFVSVTGLYPIVPLITGHTVTLHAGSV